MTAILLHAQTLSRPAEPGRYNVSPYFLLTFLLLLLVSPLRLKAKSQSSLLSGEW